VANAIGRAHRGNFPPLSYALTFETYVIVFQLQPVTFQTYLK
jgi:hypothetical protein